MKTIMLDIPDAKNSRSTTLTYQADKSRVYIEMAVRDGKLSTLIPIDLLPEIVNALKDKGYNVTPNTNGNWISWETCKS